jgi:hypothetical protein
MTAHLLLDVTSASTSPAIGSTNSLGNYEAISTAPEPAPKANLPILMALHVPCDKGHQHRFHLSCLAWCAMV